MNRMRWIDRLIRRSVVAHTTNGMSVRGVLVGAYRDCIVLSHAAYLGSDSIEPLDGEVVIPRERVAWMQILEGA